MVGLDPAGIRMVKKLLGILPNRDDHFHVNPYPGIAEDVCDRIGVIHKGVLIALVPAGVEASAQLKRGILKRSS